MLSLIIHGICTSDKKDIEESHRNSVLKKSRSSSYMPKSNSIDIPPFSNPPSELKTIDLLGENDETIVLNTTDNKSLETNLQTEKYLIPDPEYEHSDLSKPTYNDNEHIFRKILNLERRVEELQAEVNGIQEFITDIVSTSESLFDELNHETDTEHEPFSNNIKNRTNVRVQNSEDIEDYEQKRLSGDYECEYFLNDDEKPDNLKHENIVVDESINVECLDDPTREHICVESMSETPIVHKTKEQKPKSTITPEENPSTKIQE
ncbi:hypothetical protein CDIK_1459 [Cucumispora dikerogammari]|nr:hypothetical protein CDIK_1459 [Cucumispora dikerogammari]